MKKNRYYEKNTFRTLYFGESLGSIVMLSVAAITAEQ